MPWPAPAIVLLHSLGGNSLAWNHVVADLARDRVVHAPEFLGTPGSAQGMLTDNGMATRATQLVDHLLDRVVEA
ncbi:alpha/beta fold hydrolase [Nocardia sp. MW-W600-9]